MTVNSLYAAVIPYARPLGSALGIFSVSVLTKEAFAHISNGILPLQLSKADVVTLLADFGAGMVLACSGMPREYQYVILTATTLTGVTLGTALAHRSLQNAREKRHQE